MAEQETVRWDDGVLNCVALQAGYPLWLTNSGVIPSHVADDPEPTPLGPD